MPIHSVRPKRLLYNRFSPAPMTPLFEGPVVNNLRTSRCWEPNHSGLCSAPLLSLLCCSTCECRVEKLLPFSDPKGVFAGVVTRYVVVINLYRVERCARSSDVADSYCGVCESLKNVAINRDRNPNLNRPSRAHSLKSARRKRSSSISINPML